MVTTALWNQAVMRTMTEMTKMANSISPIIQWTNDCPGANEDLKMPSLDLKVWLKGDDEEGEQKILFEFYRKPNSTRLLILARSAMPSRVKRAALTAFHQLNVKLFASLE